MVTQSTKGTKPMLTTTEKFSVNLWESHPDAGNDDCDTGFDFATLAEAEAVFEEMALFGRFPAALKTTVGTYSPEHIFFQSTTHVELCRGTRDADGVKTAETLQVARTPHADKIDRRRRREASQEDLEWKRERAMQAGMAFGCDGYNDEMEY